MESPDSESSHIEALDDLRTEIARLGPALAIEEYPDDFIRAYLDGDESRAFKILRAVDVLPEMTATLSPGRLHADPASITTEINGESVRVSILDLQLQVSRQARERGETGVRLPAESTGKRIAIAGGGPAGLAAAIRLLEFGHSLEIFEHADQLGGMPQRVISSFRLPDISPEIGAILEPARLTGRLRLNLGRTLGEDLDLDQLRSAGDAVLLAVGVWQERSIGDADGVVSGLGFLESVKRGRIDRVPERIALLTGGDSAMDAAAQVQRLGARRIFVVFAETRSEMHWHMAEEWFQTPGVETKFRCRPLGYQSDETGSLIALRLLNRESGREEVLPVDLAVEAMGLEVADPVRKTLSRLPQDEAGRVQVSEEFRTCMDGIYAVGGLVNGGASVGQCVAEGMKAAEVIHRDLQ